MSESRSDENTPRGGGGLQHTPLHDLHVELGARLVPFAGYEMPVSYPLGVLKEHLHTRAAAGLFDVSHMGQAELRGPDHATTAAALEAIVPGAIAPLGPGAMRYTVLLNDSGGIIDDLMVTRPAGEADDGRLLVIVNAARKHIDYPHIAAALPDGVSLDRHDDRALLALQGPAAARILAAHCPDSSSLGFMRAADTTFDGTSCHVSRSGYTGEDGFEISLPAGAVEAVARALLDHDDVEPIGLGARDSLRLEAGLCLYGHDLDEQTSPVEADIAWVIGKKRREAGDFPGAGRILRELRGGPPRLRVGIRPEGRAPAREGAEIVAPDGTAIGVVTSGGFGPSVGGPVAMGYVETARAETGSPLGLVVRGKQLEARVAELPFVPHRYVRQPQ